MMPIPQSELDITALWLAGALADHFGIAESDIQAATFDRLGEADSVTGTVLRARLRYRDAGTSGPRSVIVKLPRTQETRTAVNNAMYSREVEFYRRLAPGIGMSIPHAYYSAVDADSGDYVLVLEDFPTLRAGKNEDGASASEARVLLAEMAALHARWWGSRELDATPSWRRSRACSTATRPQRSDSQSSLNVTGTLCSRKSGLYGRHSVGGSVRLWHPSCVHRGH